MEGMRNHNKERIDKGLEAFRESRISDYVDDIVAEDNASLALNGLIFSLELLSGQQLHRVVAAICDGKDNYDGRFSYALITSNDTLVEALSWELREVLLNDILQKGDPVLVEALKNRSHLLGLDTFLPQIQEKLNQINAGR